MAYASLPSRTPSGSPSVGGHDLGRRACGAEDRDVVVGVAADDLARANGPVGERDRDVGRVGHHVQAREDVAGEVDDDAAADPLVDSCPAARLRALGLDEHQRRRTAS